MISFFSVGHNCYTHAIVMLSFVCIVCFLYRLSYSHFDVGHDLSTFNCWSSSGHEVQSAVCVSLSVALWSLVIGRISILILSIAIGPSNLFPRSLVPRRSPPAHSTRLGAKCRDVTDSVTSRAESCEREENAWVLSWFPRRSVAIPTGCFVVSS